jgi:hypothetical protein
MRLRQQNGSIDLRVQLLIELVCLRDFLLRPSVIARCCLDVKHGFVPLVDVTPSSIHQESLQRTGMAGSGIFICTKYAVKQNKIDSLVKAKARFWLYLKDLRLK